MPSSLAREPRTFSELVLLRRLDEIVERSEEALRRAAVQCSAGDTLISAGPHDAPGAMQFVCLCGWVSRPGHADFLVREGCGRYREALAGRNRAVALRARLVGGGEIEQGRLGEARVS